MGHRLRLGIRRQVAVVGPAIGMLLPLGVLTLVALVLEAGKRWS